MSEPTPGDIEIRGYRLSPVYGRVGKALADEIVAMWLAAGVLPADEARRRVDEVVVTIRNPDGEVAGVNTVYVRQVPGGSGAWYFYRTFVRPADRGTPGVTSGALRAAVGMLRDHPHPKAPLGIVVVVENPKLSKRGPMRRLEHLGFHLVGRDAGGQDVWCLKFDGTVPAAPQGLLRPL